MVRDNDSVNVTLDGITKQFGDVVAVQDLSVTIDDGHLVGLLGPSGCGKSTTLYLIAGLLSPTGGRVLFGDDDVTDLPPEKRGIGLVFQNYALYPHFTVRDNILFPLENMKVPRAEALDRAHEMAKLVQIDELMDRRPAQLSGGQQQRVAVARALAKQPRVLLLDEPLSNLDARLRLETREEIKRIQRETGITTIFVTHDQEEAMSITDSIVLMKAGVLQQKASPQEMYRSPTNSFVAQFLGNPPINFFEGSVENGSVLIAGGRVGTTAAPPGDVLVGIRPESWRVLDGGIPVRVEMIETIGRDKLIRFEVGGTPVRAIVDSDFECDVDQTITVGAGNRVLLFDLESGNRVDGAAAGSPEAQE